MTERQLRRIRAEADALRQRGGVKSRELQRVAGKLRRRKRKHRTAEPMWVSEPFPYLRPLAIPEHPGDLNRFTARTVLDELEKDMGEWEKHLGKPAGGGEQ